MIQDVSPPIRNEQVVEAVVVVIAGAARLSPSGVGQACLSCHVGERAVPVVSKKVACRPSVLRRLVKGRAIDEKDVEPSVVVVIDERDSAAHLLKKKSFVLRRAGHILCAIQAGLGGDVREGHPGRSRHRSGRRQCEESLCKG